MSNILYYIFGVISFIILILNLVVINNIAHELSHYFDIRNIENVEVIDICFLGTSLGRKSDISNNSIGYIEHIKYKYNDSIEVNSSENKAIIVGLITLILFYMIIRSFFDEHIDRLKSWENGRK